MITGATDISVREKRAYIWAPMAAYALIALTLLREAIPWTSVNFIIGIAGLPLAIAGSERGRTTWRMLPWTFIAALLCFLLPSRTMLFAAFFLAVAGMCEQLRGRLGSIPLLIIVLMSPMAQYLAVMFSFPLRLAITDVAGSIMRGAGLHVSVAGNTISWNGIEYSVDPACMGLKMLLTSLLCGLLIIAVMQRRYERRLKGYYISAISVAILLLNILANLLRIITLVFFHIGADNVLHELTGLVYLAVYVLLPATLLIGFLVRRYGVAFDTPAVQQGEFSRAHIMPHMGLAILLASASIMHRNVNEERAALVVIPGYEAAYYDKDVCRYSNSAALVYIKRTNGLLGAEHNPAMCWLGAGYQFARINEERIGGMMVYTARLVKGKEKLYTAWWYDNGATATTSQLAWRWDVLNGGKPYSIVNVTTATEAALNGKLRELSEYHVFRAAL